LAASSARLLAHLPPPSRLRQVILWRLARLSTEAFNRRDFDALLTAYRADCEFHAEPRLVEMGLAMASYRGLGGYRDFVASSSDVWGPDWRIYPVELIDMGARIVTLYDVPVRGHASGFPFTGKFATVADLKDGRVIRDQVYFDHAEALQAVGLSEPAPRAR
jgi:SnoaL-like domain